jgi:hypothetical protein
MRLELLDGLYAWVMVLSVVWQAAFVLKQSVRCLPPAL